MIESVTSLVQNKWSRKISVHMCELSIFLFVHMYLCIYVYVWAGVGTWAHVCVCVFVYRALRGSWEEISYSESWKEEIKESNGNIAIWKQQGKLRRKNVISLWVAEGAVKGSSRGRERGIKYNNIYAWKYPMKSFNFNANVRYI